MSQLYSMGTELVTGADWYGGSGFISGRALCEDGQVRTVRFPRGGHADTFFSVPAVVTVNGRTVTGFVSVSTVAGYDTPTDDDPAVVRFTAYRYGRNADMIRAQETAL